MEYWDHRCSIWLKNNTVHGINKPLFQHSIIPCRRHKTSVVKSYMISICYRNSETLPLNSFYFQTGKSGQLSLSVIQRQKPIGVNRQS